MQPRGGDATINLSSTIGAPSPRFQSKSAASCCGSLGLAMVRDRSVLRNLPRSHVTHTVRSSARSILVGDAVTCFADKYYRSFHLRYLSRTAISKILVSILGTVGLKSRTEHRKAQYSQCRCSSNAVLSVLERSRLLFVGPSSSFLISTVISHQDNLRPPKTLFGEDRDLREDRCHNGTEPRPFDRCDVRPYCRCGAKTIAFR